MGCATVIRPSGRCLSAAVGLLSLFWLGGCASGDRSQPQLAKACQFKACVCADEGAMFWQAAATVPLVWQPNGDAGCAPGYGLRVVGPKAKP